MKAYRIPNKRLDDPSYRYMNHLLPNEERFIYGTCVNSVSEMS